MIPGGGTAQPVATTRAQWANRQRNLALATLERRLAAIVTRFGDEVDSTRARALFGSVLLKAECDLVDADLFEAADRKRGGRVA